MREERAPGQSVRGCKENMVRGEARESRTVYFCRVPARSEYNSHPDNGVFPKMEGNTPRIKQGCSSKGRVRKEAVALTSTWEGGANERGVSDLREDAFEGLNAAFDRIVWFPELRAEH